MFYTSYSWYNCIPGITEEISVRPELKHSLLAFIYFLMLKDFRRLLSAALSFHRFYGSNSAWVLYTYLYMHSYSPTPIFPC